MNRKVLIIDDDPSIHSLIGLELGHCQIDWISAFDGEAGLQIAERQHPDLILLDVDMPHLNGHEVCRRLKSDVATLPIPILFLTSAASRDAKVAGLDLGAADYITKPFDPFEVRARIKTALRTKQTVDHLTERNMIDEVTGLYNRTFLDRQLHASLAQARRWGRPLACILVEIDYWDDIYMEHGRAGTEAVLRSLTSVMMEACREEDLVCRYGPEQFGLLAFATDIQDATELAERICADIGARETAHGIATLKTTASCGVAIAQFTWGQTILNEAEGALCHARHTGGNCVKAAGQVAQMHCG